MDPKTTPHRLWNKFKKELERYFELTKVKNLVDTIWNFDPLRNVTVKTHNSAYSGVDWQSKTETLKHHLQSHRCDAMVGNIRFIV
jgi:hypothetical protein